MAGGTSAKAIVDAFVAEYKKTPTRVKVCSRGTWIS